MVKIRVSKRLQKKYPGVEFTALQISKISNKKSSALDKEITQVTKTITAQHIENYRSVLHAEGAFHRLFNKNYPIEFQLQTLASKKSFPTTTPLKDILFLNEMKHAAMISGHDVDLIKGDLCFDLGTGDGSYEDLSGRRKAIKSDDVVLTDNGEVITSLLYGPGNSTKITEKTTNCLYLLWFFHTPSAKRKKDIVTSLKKDIKNISDDNTSVHDVDVLIETHERKTVVTPWEVEGDINYDKLIHEFGLQRLDKLPEAFHKNLLFRRKKIFAHRDFKIILDAYKAKKPFCLMTGLMPTGKFHIGHMILAKQMIFYQELGAKLYICVADIEAYTARGQSLEESRKKAVEEYILNYIALGMKPENAVIYFQSDRSTDATISTAYHRLQNMLSRHTTFNQFRAVYGEISPGKMSAALVQFADILHPQLPELEGPIPTFVPVGVDQDPHIRLTRDICKRFKDHKFQQIASTYHLFVPGLKGGKMSSSDDTSYIALTDDPATIKKKVNKYAFSGGQDTVEEHRKKGGNPEVDVPYQWLTFLEEDDEKLQKIYDDYKAGTLLSGELKAILIEKLQTFLADHHQKRTQARKILSKFV